MIIISDTDTTHVYSDTHGVPWVAVVSSQKPPVDGVVCILVDSEMLDEPMKFWAETPRHGFDMIERYCPLLRFAFSVDLGEMLDEAIFDFGN